MKPRLLCFLLAAAIMALVPACVSTDNGTAREPNWPLIETTARSSVKWATKLVLDKNPGYADSAAAVSAAVATVFAGVPTAESVQGHLVAILPNLTPADAAILAAAFMDAYGAYVAATGRTELISTDIHVEALVAAITSGIADGVMLHRATQPIRP